VLLSVGVWDKDVPDRYLMCIPKLYELGRKDSLFNFVVFWAYILNGVAQAAAAYLLVLYAYDVAYLDLWVGGTYLITLVVFVANFKIALEKGAWNWPDVWIWVISNLTWPAVALFFQAPLSFNLQQTSAWLFTGVFSVVMQQAQTWALGFLMLVLLLFRDWTWKQLRPVVAPDLRHHVAYHAKLSGRPFNDPTPLDPERDLRGIEILAGLPEPDRPSSSTFGGSFAASGALAADAPLKPAAVALDPAKTEV